MIVWLKHGQLSCPWGSKLLSDISQVEFGALFICEILCPVYLSAIDMGQFTGVFPARNKVSYRRCT
jgi:hypothetical protein